MNVTLSPSLMYSYFVLSNGSPLFYHNKNGVYNALVNSTVDFYVYGNYDSQTTTQKQGVPPFPTTLVVTTVSMIAAVIAFSLLLFIRHRKNQVKKGDRVKNYLTTG
jgi:multisubunit Na+/H+ antiporter MnhC subunit